MFKIKGFTLIELMVVMAVVALLVGLVGPLTMQQLDKAQAKAELLNLKRELVAVSQRAFFSDMQLTAKLAGKELSVFSEDNQTIIYNKNFDYLFFQPQEIVFNNIGFVSLTSINANYRDEPLTINLNDLINKPYAFNQNNVGF
ncbi:conserved hypothetical protein [Pseudoalteromonas sp. 3J6]|uniref:prepilin-type N-terminal cleavage/methylation domain-containing protein n=1 Tax=unclassified Pseudoalteromonas TaxID=194690 RepID=UPI00175AEE5B|nr:MULTISPECIES: prepilin-type N-terminal cleavage/methylation domain-containing protein [unclassified Pseudoalteromonas]CAD2223395.1 conserved hypothetical protein [Pseudoalteromonas sp. 3J6]